MCSILKLKKVFFSICLALGLGTRSFAKYNIYYVKKNDQLGLIIQNLDFDIWLWGEEGLVKHIVKVNKNKFANILKNPDYLVEGQEIYLPSSKSFYMKEVNILERAQIPVAKDLILNKGSKLIKNASTKIKRENTDKRPEFKPFPFFQLSLLLSLVDKSFENQSGSSIGVIKSKINIGIGGKAFYPITEKFIISSQFHFESITFTDGKIRKINQLDKYYYGFGLSAHFLNSFLNTEIGIKAQKESLVTLISSTGITLEGYTNISPFFNFEKIYFNFRGVEIGNFFYIEYGLGTNQNGIEIDKTIEWKVGMTLQRKVSPSFQLKTVPFYSKKIMTSSLYNNSESIYGFNIVFEY